VKGKIMKRWNDDELQKQIDALKKQLDKHQRKHDAALVNAVNALTVQVTEIGVAIREVGGSGLTEAEAVEVRDGLLMHVHKLMGTGQK
jgi:flagellar hook-associated protein FlgK